MPHDGSKFRLPVEGSHPRHRRLSPRARGAYFRPAACRADFHLRGDGDREGPVLTTSLVRNARDREELFAAATGPWVCPPAAKRRGAVMSVPPVQKGAAAIGECMNELSGHEDGYWRLGFAGDTFNTLWALRALSIDRPATYVSAFGDDPFSRDQIAFFSARGIGIGASPRIAGSQPGIYAITLSGAERSFTYRRNDSAARQLASDPAALSRSLQNQSLVYFSGITLAIL